MNQTEPNPRRAVYGVLIALAASLTAGRIASVERLHEPSVHKAAGSPVPRPAWPAARPEPSPTFGSNDRSRWAAARALVEEGTFVVGRRDPVVGWKSAVAMLAADGPWSASVLYAAGYSVRVRSDSGVVFEDGFQSVDKVLHPETLHYYSTKPPLLTLLMAAEYAALRSAFGWSMRVEADMTTEQKARAYEARFHVTRVALVTFNLLPLILYLCVLASLAERLAVSDWARYFVVAAGAFATMVTPFQVTINNHTLATTAAAVLLYAAVRLREDGPSAWLHLAGGFAAGLLVCFELPGLALAAGVFVYLAWRQPRWVVLFVLAALVPVVVSLAANYAQLGQFQPAYSKFGGPWYEYEGSHWLPQGVTKRGIDYAGRNGETKGEYAFHLLVGHHGVFSLTPVMLLAVAGMAAGAVRWLRSPREARAGDLLGGFGLLVTAVVLGFYVQRTDNYGGWSNGPRWLMFLSPLWLACLIPAADVLARSRVGRLLGLTLLGLSIASMSYQNWNPWRHPWIYNWMESRGWVDY